MRGLRQWKWHLYEMYVKLNGEMVYLWRAGVSYRLSGRAPAREELVGLDA